MPIARSASQDAVLRVTKRRSSASRGPAPTCGNHLHPTAGTIFHKSSTSLHLWFYAMYLMTSTRCGISAKQLERELGVTYKTAWRMAHLIRHKLMADQARPLSGEVEMDEMYIGGKPRLSGRRKKTPVFGMVERKGRVAAVTAENITKDKLMQHVERYVLPASQVFTDESPLYGDIAEAGYHHRQIKTPGARVRQRGCPHADD